MKMSKLSASAKRKIRRQTKRHKERYRAFRVPITLEQVCEFSSRLVRVDYGGQCCWLYPGKSVGGGSKVYARMKFNGELIMAHRFALAVKLGCTLWDLEGYDAAHSSKVLCIGGRCCNPEHLFKKTSEQNRSWDRAKDAARYGDKATTRSEKEIKSMMDAMYPIGMPNDGKLFDEPWEQNVSPLLRQVLEMGMKHELENMHLDRENAAHTTA
ncbi:MAG TPA: hypothetical protein VHV29_07850 [Terriglobales bacterium]|jgi:hypothetical protein|nr:hypothetical protein [Terriglobales bacterium]